MLRDLLVRKNLEHKTAGWTGELCLKPKTKRFFLLLILVSFILSPINPFIYAFLIRPDIMKAVILQRERLDMSTNSQRKAAECSDLLLMALYTLIPPSRGTSTEAILLSLIICVLVHVYTP